MDDFREPYSGAIWFSDLELLLDRQSPLQRIRYFRSPDFGRLLVIGNELQHVEAWASFYHEIVVHLPASFIDCVKSVLIIGGGSLFVAEEVIKYSSVKRIDMIDYDRHMIRATLEAYPERRYIIEDSRLNIQYIDYNEALRLCDTKYDLIINDCFDTVEADKNFDGDLYITIDNLLSCDGIYSDLVYRSIYNEGAVKSAICRIKASSNRALSMLAVPEYPGIFHVLLMWGKNSNLSQKAKSGRNKQTSLMQQESRLLIFNPNAFDHYLYLPPYLTKFTE